MTKLTYPLVSGGIDSTLAMIKAKEVFGKIKPIFFDYGHKAKSMELEAVRKICSKLGIETPEIIKADMHWDNSYLTKGNDIQKFILYGRNLIFISLASSFVKTNGGGTIVVGFNRSDAGYDTNEEFIDKVNAILQTEKEVSLFAPLIKLNKRRVIKYYEELGHKDILKLTYSCYKGSKKPCNECHACKSRKNVLNPNKLRRLFGD